MAGSKEDGEAVREESKTVLIGEVEIFDGTPLLFFHLRVPPCQVCNAWFLSFSSARSTPLNQIHTHTQTSTGECKAELFVFLCLQKHECVYENLCVVFIYAYAY